MRLTTIIFFAAFFFFASCDDSIYNQQSSSSENQTDSISYYMIDNHLINYYVENELEMEFEVNDTIEIPYNNTHRRYIIRDEEDLSDLNFLIYNN